MLIPVTLYDVKTGAAADDPAAVTIATARAAGAADEAVRGLMRTRHLFEGVPEFFVSPRTASVEAESAAAAKDAGYEIRFVLAPVTPPGGTEPVSEAPGVGEEGSPS